MLKHSLTLILAILLCCIGPAVAADDPIGVFYTGPEGSVRTALTLAKRFRIVSEPVDADVLVLNGTIPDPEGMAEMIRSGIGLVLIPGPDMTAESVGTLLGTPVSLERQADPLSLTDVEGVNRYGSDCAGDRCCRHLDAPNGLCPICVDHDRPLHDTDSRFLRDVSTCAGRLAAV